MRSRVLTGVTERLPSWRRGSVVLLYHRIADPASAPGGDPWRLCVDPATFAGHMEIIADLGGVVPLGAIADTLARGETPQGQIAVTFDDGYQDNLVCGLQVLDRLSIPATVFLVSGECGRVFWWDRLASLLQNADPSKPLRLDTAGGSVEWRGVAGRKALRDRVAQALSVLEPAERDVLLDQLAETWEVDGIPDLPRAMTWQEVRSLVESGLVEPGGHTVTHPPLADIDCDRARAEIMTGRSELQSRLGRPLGAFAYPHGSTGARIRELVRDAGYRLACHTSRGPVRPRTDPLHVPRVWVHNWSPKQFRGRILKYLASEAGNGP
ncbi:MAG: polysaccharide deacetylase family protein [Gemmatimonadota bacterium]